MQTVHPTPSIRIAEARRIDLAAFALWLVPAVLIVYLALQNGGYGVVERSEVGIAVWWIVVVGAVVGAFPTRATLSPLAIGLFAVLAAFTLWTALSLTWTESDERTAIELARVAGYAGIFALAVGVQSGERWRWVLAGVVTGVSVVVSLAVLSRLEPNLFPEQVAADFFPGGDLERRLAYPLNYSTGLAVLAAMAIPLLLSVTSSARHIALGSLAASLVAIAVLALWLTASSLTIPLLLIAVASYLFLCQDRVAGVATVAISLAGGALLILGVEQRDALDSGVVTPAALEQGDEMTLMMIVVCAGVALMQAGGALLVRHAARPAWMQPSRKTKITGLGIGVAFALVVILATPIRGEIGDGWEKFRDQSDVDAASSSRLEQVLDPSSRGRYQFWQAAYEAGKSEPLTGIGAGTFEFWWMREREPGGTFARDAHSLFLESFAELGLLGVALIAVFTIGAVGVGVVRTLRAPPSTRAWLAGAASAAIVFVAAASVDWMWELSLLPGIFMVLVAVLVVAGREHEAVAAPPGWVRAVLATVGIAAIAVIVVPFSSATSINESRSAVASSELDAALERADDARAVEPYAATPELQRALVFEQAGDLESAVTAAREAAANEATNWRTWLVLSRLEARNGNADASVEAYRKARSLNPLSPIFPPTE